MNTAATPWYRAVPSMFTVAPIGKTKLVTCLLTPRFDSQLCLVTGEVADELEVEKASSWASRIAARKRQGFRRPIPATISR